MHFVEIDAWTPARIQGIFERMRMCKRGALLNPCPPFFRGEEVGADAIDSKYFVGHAFKRDLLRVQQAIILYGLY